MTKGGPRRRWKVCASRQSSEYKQRLEDWLRSAYADVLGYVDPATDDDTSLRDAFRSYKPVGQQARMVTLFTGLFATAGIRPESKKAKSGRKPGGKANSQRAPQEPQVNEIPSKPENPSRPEPKHDRPKHQGHYHQFVEGLLATLPPEGGDWPPRERVKWLTIAARAFDMIYTGDNGETIICEVKAAPAQKAETA